MNNDLISRYALMNALRGNVLIDVTPEMEDTVEELPGAYTVEQEKIINKVLGERKRQDAKWGEQNHPAPVWGTIIGEEYGEMCQAINEFLFNPTPDTEEQICVEAIHTMASCMAMLECIERQRGALREMEKPIKTGTEHQQDTRDTAKLEIEWEEEKLAFAKGLLYTKLTTAESEILRNVRIHAINMAAMVEDELLRRGEEF